MVFILKWVPGERSTKQTVSRYSQWLQQFPSHTYTLWMKNCLIIKGSLPYKKSKFPQIGLGSQMCYNFQTLHWAWSHTVMFWAKFQNDPTIEMDVYYGQTRCKFETSLGNGFLVSPRSDIILCMRPANDRQRYNAMSCLIGWAHTQNDPWWSPEY